MKNSEFAAEVLKKATYFGELIASDDYTTLIFESDYVNNNNSYRQYYEKFGDCVYFAYYRIGQELRELELGKIGKTESLYGWYNRSRQYERGIDADQTNKLVLNRMKDMGVTTLYIYALACPRQMIDIRCPLTGKMIRREIKVARCMEEHYTETYRRENDGNELPLCKQLK